jgi:hypothetical protein
MSFGSIIGWVGLLVSGLGGFWYWRLMLVAVSFAGTPLSANVDRTAKLALGVVCVGLLMSLIGLVVNLLSRNEDS